MIICVCISQQCLGGCLPKTALNRSLQSIQYIAQMQLFTLCWIVFTWIDFCRSTSFSFTFFCPFAPSCALSTSVIHTHTPHTSYLFSLQSLRGLQPLIVSQTGTAEKEWLGLQGVCMRETGKAGHNSLKRRKSLSHITAHIHLQDDRLNLQLSFTVPEDVSH